MRAFATLKGVEWNPGNAEGTKDALFKGLVTFEEFRRCTVAMGKDAELSWDERQSTSVLPSVFGGSVVAGEVLRLAAAHPKAAFSSLCGWKKRSKGRHKSRGAGVKGNVAIGLSEEHLDESELWEYHRTNAADVGGISFDDFYSALHQASKVLRFRRSVDNSGLQGSSAFHLEGGSRLGISSMMSAPVRPWRATSSIQAFESVIMDGEENGPEDGDEDREIQAIDGTSNDRFTVLGNDKDALSELMLNSSGGIGPSASAATAPLQRQGSDQKPTATYHLRNLSAAEYDVYGRPRKTGRVRVPLVNRSAAP